MDGSNHGGIKVNNASIPPELTPSQSETPMETTTARKRRHIIDDDDDDEEDELDQNEMPEDDSLEIDADESEPFATPADAMSVASVKDLPEGTASMNWNVSEFLPETCRDIFNSVIADWIFTMWQSRISARQSRSGVARTPIKARDKDDDEMEVSEAADEALDAIRDRLMRAIPQVEKVRVSTKPNIDLTLMPY